MREESRSDDTKKLEKRRKKWKRCSNFAYIFIVLQYKFLNYTNLGTVIHACKNISWTKLVHASNIPLLAS